MPPSLRSLALAGSAGFALSLLSALPAGAHGLAGTGLVDGALHPLTGLDHLLLLIGVGALAARVDRLLLLCAVLGAVVGAVFGSLGGGLPAAEPLAALSVSALGLVLLHSRRPDEDHTPRALAGAVVGSAVALHALLHGQVASAGNPGWWVGAALAAAAVVAASTLTLARGGAGLSRTVALVLSFGGLLLALAPIV
jgi:urease accessory protein